MSLVDVAILVVLGVFLLKGVVRGLLREVCSLLGLGVGALLALRFHGPLAETLAATFGLPPKVCAVITFVLVFMAVVLIFWGLGHLLSRFVRLLFLGGLNRVAGAFFGLAQGFLLLAVLLFSLADGSAPKLLQPALQRSQLAPPFIRLGGAIFRGGQQTLEDWR